MFIGRRKNLSVSTHDNSQNINVNLNHAQCFVLNLVRLRSFFCWNCFWLNDDKINLECLNETLDLE